SPRFRWAPERPRRRGRKFRRIAPRPVGSRRPGHKPAPRRHSPSKWRQGSGRDPSRVVTCEIHAASLCACLAQGAARCLAAGGEPGGFILLSRGTSEKRSTTATIADGAADRSDEVGIGGPCPVNLLRSDFYARMRETSNAKDHFLIRRTLAFMIRIWQGKVGQYCCPNWRLAR